MSHPQLVVKKAHLLRIEALDDRTMLSVASLGNLCSVAPNAPAAPSLVPEQLAEATIQPTITAPEIVQLAAEIPPAPEIVQPLAEIQPAIDVFGAGQNIISAVADELNALTVELPQTLPVAVSAVETALEVVQSAAFTRDENTPQTTPHFELRVTVSIGVTILPDSPLIDEIAIHDQVEVPAQTLLGTIVTAPATSITDNVPETSTTAGVLETIATAPTSSITDNVLETSTTVCVVESVVSAGVAPTFEASINYVMGMKTNLGSDQPAIVDSNSIRRGRLDMERNALLAPDSSDSLAHQAAQTAAATPQLSQQTKGESSPIMDADATELGSDLSGVKANGPCWPIGAGVVLESAPVVGPMLVTGDSPIAASDAATLFGAGLAAGAVDINTSALDEALRQFLDGADQFVRAITRSLAGPGMIPWLLAGLTCAAALEMRRRRKQRMRLAPATPSLTADSAFSWEPGMPGTFIEEMA